MLSIDNNGGLAAVFDFLAELPTLDAALTASQTKLTLKEDNGTPLSETNQNESSHKEVSQLRLPALEGSKFFIGTDSPNPIKIGLEADFQPIMIELKEFAREALADDDFPMPIATGESPTLDNDFETGEGITIAGPDQANSQLVDGWNGSFGHVA